MRLILHVGDRALDLATLVALTRDERTFSTFEAWKRAVRAINPNASIEGDREIANAPGVGEWDGEKGVIYDSALRRTGDQIELPEHEELTDSVHDAGNGVYFSARPLGSGSWGIRTLTYRSGRLETENLNTTPWPTEGIALLQAERAARGEAEREDLPFRGRARDSSPEELRARAKAVYESALKRASDPAARAQAKEDYEATLKKIGSKDAGVRVVYNRLLGGWYVVTGPHQTPLNGRFDTEEEARAWLASRSSRDAESPEEALARAETMRERARSRFQAAKTGSKEWSEAEEDLNFWQGKVAFLRSRRKTA